MTITYIKELGGTKATYKNETIGWITVRCNNKHGFIPCKIQDKYKSHDFSTEDKAKEAFEQYFFSYLNDPIETFKHLENANGNPR